MTGNIPLWWAAAQALLVVGSIAVALAVAWTAIVLLNYYPVAGFSLVLIVVLVGLTLLFYFGG
jgi:hypothetical protein